jgi:hypothetical protein
VTDIGAMTLDDALVHFGVKGMKWGVTKTPDKYASTETRKERKQSAKALNDYMWDSIMKEPMWHTMTEAEVKSLSNKGQTFAENTSLKRITTDKTTTLKGAMYVSQLKADSEFYKAALPAVGPQVVGKMGGGQKNYKTPTYEVHMQTVKKLSLPSEKERYKAFYELLNEPSIKLEGKTAPVTGRQYLESQGYKKLFGGKLDDQTLVFRSYHDFVQGQGDQDAAINKAYYDKLKSKGYNALLDANDAGTYTKNPLILIDPKGTVKIKEVRRLSADEINQAQRRLKKGG